MRRVMARGLVAASTLLMACGGFEPVTEDELGTAPAVTLSFSGYGFTSPNSYFLKVDGTRSAGPSCRSGGAGPTLGSPVVGVVGCVPLTFNSSGFALPATAGLCPGTWTFANAALYNTSGCAPTTKSATCLPAISPTSVGAGSATVRLNCTKLPTTVSFVASSNYSWNPIYLTMTGIRYSGPACAGLGGGLGQWVVIPGCSKSPTTPLPLCPGYWEFVGDMYQDSVCNPSDADYRKPDPFASFDYYGVVIYSGPNEVSVWGSCPY